VKGRPSVRRQPRHVDRAHFARVARAMDSRAPGLRRQTLGTEACDIATVELRFPSRMTTRSDMFRPGLAERIGRSRWRRWRRRLTSSWWLFLYWVLASSSTGRLSRIGGASISGASRVRIAGRKWRKCARPARPAKACGAAARVRSADARWTNGADGLRPDAATLPS
jgi:hypothetical protein